jgi:hypothetical protein
MLLTSRHYYNRKHKRSVDTYCRFESFSAATNRDYGSLFYQASSRTEAVFRLFILYGSQIQNRLQKQGYYRSETR